MFKDNVRAEEVLELILTALGDLVDYELAVILKVQDDEKLAVKKAMGKLLSDNLRDYSISLADRTDIAELMNAGKPHLFSEDIPHEDTYAEILDLPDGHSCLVSPLQFHERPIGMLTLDHSACNMFSPQIVNFIGTISKLISIILVQNDSSEFLQEQQRILAQERNLLLSSGSEKFADVIGDSKAWKEILDSVKIVAASDVSVLIQGETGTGKEEIARLIHKLSPRSSKPFIALNCSTLTAGLAESALFGHEKGAFTDAYRTRKGQFELADGGTLFLDEIGDLPLEIQPKLLRAVQEGVFERVGGEQPIKSDVRIITASHIDLKIAVTNKDFREDLYYRIGVFPLFLPPLRERDNDVILLAEFFLGKINSERSGSPLTFSRSAVEQMLQCRWPGNVRELQNRVKRAALLAGMGDIEGIHLGFDDESPVPVSGAVTAADFPSLDYVAAEHIRKALKISEGRIYGAGGAAELLGLKPTTLQSRIKKLEINYSNKVKLD